MKILRSPDDAIDGLSDYPAGRRYVEIPTGDEEAGSGSSTLRVNVIDAGRADAPAVVMLHGNPSWSYLWNKPVVTIFSDKDIVAPNEWRPIVGRIPGAAGQPHLILEGGAHFLQEDIPEAYNDALLAWLGPVT